MLLRPLPPDAKRVAALDVDERSSSASAELFAADVAAAILAAAAAVAAAAAAAAAAVVAAAAALAAALLVLSVPEPLPLLSELERGGGSNALIVEGSVVDLAERPLPLADLAIGGWPLPLRTRLAQLSGPLEGAAGGVASVGDSSAAATSSASAAVDSATSTSFASPYPLTAYISGV